MLTPVRWCGVNGTQLSTLNTLANVRASAKINGMLIPRFTVRWMLFVLSASGVFFLFVSLAIRGHDWAIGVSTALGSLLLTLLIQAVFFGAAWLLVSLLGFTRRRHLPKSPFAQQQPPPQWLPPMESDTAE